MQATSSLSHFTGVCKACFPPPTVCLEGVACDWGGHEKSVKYERDTLELLMNMKINCEEKDPGTSLQQRFMSRVQNKSGSLRCAAFSLATVNSRAVYEKVIASTSGKTDLRRGAIIATFKAAVASCEAEGSSVFTRAFNRQAGNKCVAAQGVLARVRLQKALRASRIPLKLGKNGHAGRKAIQFHCCKSAGRLLGKNAYAILERLFMSHRPRPSWVTDPGSVLGPGARSGANVLEGLEVGVGSKSDTLDDLNAGWRRSRALMNKLTRRFKAEKSRLRALKPGPQEEEPHKLLLAACDVIISKTDAELQFVYCELSKVVRFMPNLHPRYQRRPGTPLANAPCEEAVPDDGDMGDQVSHNGDEDELPASHLSDDEGFDTDE